jgi:hypothetical protein
MNYRIEMMSKSTQSSQRSGQAAKKSKANNEDTSNTNTIKEMPDKHFLCGGDFCTSGDKHCVQPVAARKDFALGHVRGNISLICCFVAQSLNRKGIQGLGGKIKPFHKCPCGSGIRMKKCMKKT